jgi:hypothetical protein
MLLNHLGSKLLSLLGYCASFIIVLFKIKILIYRIIIYILTFKIIKYMFFYKITNNLNDQAYLNILTMAKIKIRNE